MSRVIKSTSSNTSQCDSEASTIMHPDVTYGKMFIQSINSSSDAAMYTSGNYDIPPKTIGIVSSISSKTIPVVLGDVSFKILSVDKNFTLWSISIKNKTSTLKPATIIVTRPTNHIE